MFVKAKFLTLDKKYYFLNIKEYEIDWNGKSASKMQYDAKQFFRQIWKRDFVCEEFLVRPLFKYKYRIDFFNFTRKIAVEIHGSPSHVKYSEFFNKDEDAFWDGIERDRTKQLFCEHNGITLIEIYPKQLPITLEWLKKKYPTILWPKLL